MAALILKILVVYCVKKKYTLISLAKRKNHKKNLKSEVKHYSNLKKNQSRFH